MQFDSEVFRGKWERMTLRVVRVEVKHSETLCWGIWSILSQRPGQTLKMTGEFQGHSSLAALEKRVTLVVSCFWLFSYISLLEFCWILEKIDFQPLPRSCVLPESWDTVEFWGSKLATGAHWRAVWHLSAEQDPFSFSFSSGPPAQ